MSAPDTFCPMSPDMDKRHWWHMTPFDWVCRYCNARAPRTYTTNSTDPTGAPPTIQQEVEIDYSFGPHRIKNTSETP